MNARRVNAAAGVILAAQKRRQTAAGVAAALEAAGLLQSPESAAEVVALREQAGRAPAFFNRSALEARVYDSIVTFNSVACWPVLQVPQMRQYLAEHLAMHLAPELERMQARVDEVERRYTFDTAALKKRVAELEAQRAAVLALHRKRDDSAHCVADDETWPCPTRTTLGASSETECPSCAAPADVTGYRIPQHRTGCPQAVTL